MANTIITKNSSVAGVVPTASSLVEAELAVNTADAVLFTKNAAGTVIELGVPKSHIGSGGSTHATATITVAGFLSAADKTKLDGVAAGANLYALPIATASALGGVKQGTGVTIDGAGVISVPVVNSSAVTTALGFTPANQATTYTKVETDSRIQAVVGAAPAALDTLVEIATQLANDESAVSALTTTVSGKQATITGAASTITSANLAASMVMVSDANGKAAAHATVSTVEIGYLDGVTSNVQTQINAKVNTSAVGTIASQNANAVAITGGTASGLTITNSVVNGGTF